MSVTTPIQQRLTVQVLAPHGPRLGRVKVGVPPDAVAGEVGVSQEAALSIERAAVPVETIGEEEHNVGELLHLVPDVAVGDLPETKRGDGLPHLEGIPDGLVALVLAHLRGVVLYAARCEGAGRHVIISSL